MDDFYHCVYIFKLSFKCKVGFSSTTFIYFFFNLLMLVWTHIVRCYSVHCNPLLSLFWYTNYSNFSIRASEVRTDIQIIPDCTCERTFLTTNMSFWCVPSILWALLGTIRLRYSRIILYFPCFTIGFCF